MQKSQDHTGIDEAVSDEAALGESRYGELEASNEDYQAQFEGAGAPGRPQRKLAVITCMDARLQPEAFLGLASGDAHVIRNAGGRVSEDAIRSLVISQQLLGTREVIVIHHTDCGMRTFTNEALRERLQIDLGVETELDFLPFTDLEESVLEDVVKLRESPLILSETIITGAIYDVANGKLTRVEGD